jgi:hypothetical protein
VQVALGGSAQFGGGFKGLHYLQHAIALDASWLGLVEKSGNQLH